MKKLLTVYLLGLSVMFSHTVSAFDLKKTFSEFTEGLKKIPTEIDQKINGNVAKTRKATIKNKNELKNKAQYIKNTDKRIKQDAEQRLQRVKAEQKQKLAQQKKQLHEQQQRIKQQQKEIEALKHTPKEIQGDVKAQSTQMAKDEKSRLKELLK